MLSPDDAAALVERILADRYPGADVGFAAGSLVRGDGTEGSDLDLVILFPALPHARRESFVAEGTPVEVFLHDPETLAFTFKEGADLGRPGMISMVADGRLCGPRPEAGRGWRRNARKLMRDGPPPMDAARRDSLRYHITDRVDDLRDPRPAEQLVALGAQLYDPIAELILRGAGRWAGNGKWIPRHLRGLDPQVAERFVAAFDALYARGDPGPLIGFAECALAPHGGWLFEGYQSAWPATNRIAPRRRR